MPIATKRRNIEKTAAPIIEAEPSPALLEEEEAPKPKVTALIFSYDNAPGLRRCLAAIENSNDRELVEILVVDCGSHDESPGMDSEFPNITMLRLPRYFGRTKALNIGTRTATTENLFFLTPEVEPMPTTIPSLLAWLDQHADIMAVAPLLLNTEGKPVEQFFDLPHPRTGDALKPAIVDKMAESASVEFASFQALLVRKYFIRGINFLDERYGDFGADAELGWQIRRAARKLVVLPRVTALFTPTQPAYSASAKNTLEADRIHGLATFFGKHYGFITGLLFRMKCIFKAAFTGKFGLAGALLSGTKIDGSQSVIL
ncbi:MAG TPA: glycosyltransferase [Bryobacteraceae bacterium]|nr:glycosyltransferase [Bryobacteraceae bacterium]